MDYDNSENQLFLEEERRINHAVSLAGLPANHLRWGGQEELFPLPGCWGALCQRKLYLKPRLSWEGFMGTDQLVTPQDQGPSMRWLEWELIWVHCLVVVWAAPKERDFWTHVKHLPWGLWESVPQQESQQGAPHGGRQAGKAP